MGIGPPLVSIPGSPQKLMVINKFNLEMTQLEIGTSQGTEELTSLKADFFHLKDQVGPGLQQLQHVSVDLGKWATQIKNLISWSKQFVRD